MRTTRVEQFVRRARPGLSSAAIHAGYLQAQRDGDPNDSEVVIERAEQWQAAHPRELLGPTSPALTARAKDTAAALAAWVATTRQAAPVALPFSTEAAAAQWIAEQGAAHLRPMPPAARECYRVASEQIAEAARLVGAVAVPPLTFPMPLKVWFRKKCELAFVWAYAGSSLVPMAEQAEGMARATGYHAADTLMHVLCGRPLPVLRSRAEVHQRWALHRESGTRFTLTTATIDLPSADTITEPNLRALTRSLRAELGLTRRRAVQGRDAELLALVQRAGRRDGEAEGARWERLRLMWNRTADRPIASRWKFKQAVERVQRRLGSVR